MDLPKILLTGLVCFFFLLFFLVFLKFLDSWAWDSKNLEKNQINQKKQKNNPEWTYPRFFSQDWFFCFFVFFGFPRVFGQLGLGQQKPREKPNKPKKPKKPILNGLTQDSSHRIGFFGFFGFLRVFGQLGLGTPKNLEKNDEDQKNKKKQSGIDLLQILLTGLFFLFLFGFP